MIRWVRRHKFPHSSSLALTYQYTDCLPVISRRNLHVAIVGSGPSGCYTAKYLLKIGLATQIDILDRLPTPFGLVRYGVAPDHPEVKHVEQDFSKLFETTNVSFYGNVRVGENVSVEELRRMYDVVVMAYGCESDRKLGIPGDQLKGVLSAREFVAWYNGALVGWAFFYKDLGIRLSLLFSDAYFLVQLRIRSSRLRPYR
jgi:NADPH-dependent glutamate synthase beta subunit-like oxidoreductase